MKSTFFSRFNTIFTGEESTLSGPHLARHFIVHTLLGVPHNTASRTKFQRYSQWAAYALLGFIVEPVIQLARLAVELPSYALEKITGLDVFMFPRLITRAVLAPFISFAIASQIKYKMHRRIAQVLSVAVSVIGITTIATFFPLMLAKLFPAAVTATSGSAAAATQTTVTSLTAAIQTSATAPSVPHALSLLGVALHTLARHVLPRLILLVGVLYQVVKPRPLISFDFNGNEKTSSEDSDTTSQRNIPSAQTSRFDIPSGLVGSVALFKEKESVNSATDQAIPTDDHVSETEDRSCSISSGM